MTAASTPDPCRRDVLAGFGLIAATLLARAGAAADAPQLAPLQSGAPVGADQFLALSQWLTGHQGLDRSTSDALLSALIGVGQDEQLATVYRTAVALQAQHTMPGEATERALQQANALNGAMTVLRGWYVGLVKEPNGKDLTVAYERTLMADVVADFLTLPTFCSGVPQYWIEPPKIADLPVDSGAQP